MDHTNLSDSEKSYKSILGPILKKYEFPLLLEYKNNGITINHKPTGFTGNPCKKKKKKKKKRSKRLK
jgi:hypothetical protein